MGGGGEQRVLGVKVVEMLCGRDWEDNGSHLLIQLHQGDRACAC